MKKLAAFFTPFIAGSLAVLLFSCNSGGGDKDDKKGTDTSVVQKTTTPVFTPYNVMLIEHQVKDFDTWKGGYLAHDSMRQAYGITQGSLGRGLEDPNTVVVVSKISDIAKAKEFASSPDLKEAMEKAGVVGKPTISYIHVLRNDSSRIQIKERMIVSHKVKDFDAWLKVYDNGEGVTKRAEYGMIDRGLARGVDDPNMVYVVFAISDMAKAKARGQSPELKKLMQDAGVLGEPKIFMYSLVQ